MKIKIRHSVIIGLTIVLFMGCRNKINAKAWTELQKIQHTPAAVSDKFAYAVDIHAQRAVVGVPFNDTASGTFNGNGSVSVYLRTSASTWTLEQQLTVPSPGYIPHLGWSVSLDDSTILASAYTDATDENGMNQMNAAGAVYLFRKNMAGTWVIAQKLVASDRAIDDYFGWDAAFDGEYLITGARFESHNASGGDSLLGAGSAYIFEKDNGTWSQAQKIVASDRDADDSFGNAVDIHGEYAIVGAWLEDQNSLGMDTMDIAGSAYIFRRGSPGSWAQVQKIVSPDRSAQELFGGAVAMGDSIAIIGCTGDAEDTTGGNVMPYAGAVYVFLLDNSGSWNFHQKIVASDRNMQDAFGNSLDLDGDRLIIGAYQDEPPPSPFNLRVGSAYIFERGANGYFHEVTKLTAADAADPDRFGNSVAIDDDIALIGAPFKQAERGAAYFFKGDTTTGIGEEPGQNRLSVFPNPCTEELNIALHFGTTESINYRIYDLSGRLLLTGWLDVPKHSISLRSLQSGTYLLHFVTKEESRVFKVVRI